MTDEIKFRQMKKDKLEQFFSDKLENFEAPYSKEAWTSLEPKLGHSAGSTGLSTGAKIALFSAVAVVVAVVTYIALPEKSEQPIHPVAQTERTVDKQPIENNESAIEQTAKDLTIETETNSSTPESANEADNSTVSGSNATNSASPENNMQSIGDAADGDNGLTIPTPNHPVVADLKPTYILGSVSANLICKGESITVSNYGKEKEVVRLIANSKTFQLASGKKTSLFVSEKTEIQFINDKDELIGKEIIQVLENPEPNFDFDANIFEKGLPVAKFTSYGNYKNISWDFGNNQSGNGSEVVAHYFDKGIFPVKIKVTDINGCVGTETKNVEIADKYNLLATNSIRLNDANHETRTFMPFCLKERNVKFNLTIIDPKDNTVVFMSNDHSKPWEGTDQRTGKILPAHKTFIWQVQLEKTIPGERGIYNGTVTIVE